MTFCSAETVILKLSQSFLFLCADPVHGSLIVTHSLAFIVFPICNMVNVLVSVTVYLSP